MSPHSMGGKRDLCMGLWSGDPGREPTRGDRFGIILNANLKRLVLGSGDEAPNQWLVVIV